VGGRGSGGCSGGGGAGAGGVGWGGGWGFEVGRVGGLSVMCRLVGWVRGRGDWGWGLGGWWVGGGVLGGGVVGWGSGWWWVVVWGRGLGGGLRGVWGWGGVGWSNWDFLAKRFSSDSSVGPGSRHAKHGLVAGHVSSNIAQSL